ncbi:MAG: CidA/LrgA family protein [Azonexaceae bacterium]|uniref:CidA/LrgA family protein n=1 Tax=Azonexus sp. R2A61 TaxID=2744443 RepID=UPI001F3CEDA4|nr:CidA/LrgA family protein [Azonexus sp. R2A61]MCE1238410.1 CidA/LrgA family protein [Azonexaceae bacterium]
MLASLSLLLSCQLIGELIAHWLALPVPGPVIGLVLLFLWLVLSEGPSDDLKQTCQTLLQHLSLLFVPAGTGIVLYLTLIGDEWPALAASLLISTLAALVVTAGVMVLVQRYFAREES